MLLRFQNVSCRSVSVGFAEKNLGFRFSLGFHDNHVVNFFTFIITSSNDKQPHTLSITHSKKQNSYELTSTISLRML